VALTPLSAGTVATVTALLAVWNLLVMEFLARIAHDFVRRYEGVPAEYVGRKVVHVLGGGITTLLIPVFFDGFYWVVVAAAFALAVYVEIRRRWRPMFWFQIPENAYEVHFALAYGAVLAIGVALGNIWIGLIPMLFMSFGDSATGIVRAFHQRRHVKSWDGTLAMFLVCMPIAIWKLGWYGIPLAVGASLVERIPRLDDNLTVPFLSAALVYLQPILGL
jgi:phytol kinase